MILLIVSYEIRETIHSHLQIRATKKIVIKIIQCSIHLYGGALILMQKLVVGAENYISPAE